MLLFVLHMHCFCGLDDDNAKNIIKQKKRLFVMQAVNNLVFK
jgi:hypothetical protein